ncbi:MAG: hypothetical protein AVDCRST_MAG55-741, partial [uncultured Rubrobacteraceae bacterium]
CCVEIPVHLFLLLWSLSSRSHRGWCTFRDRSRRPAPCCGAKL